MGASIGTFPIQSYHGLIVKLARSYWNQIPAEHKRWVDLEDVITEGSLHFVKAAPKYNPKCGTKFSTFIYTAIENNYRSLLQKLRVGMRTADLVDIEDIVLTTTDNMDRITDAEKRVNRFLELASPHLLEFLEIAFFGGGNERDRPKPSDEIKCEMLRLCRIVGAGAEDFMLVRQASIV